MPKSDPADTIAEKLKETPKLALDRLPVLNALFEGTAEACVEILRDYCSSPVTAFVNQLETRGSWDLLEAFEDSVAVIFYCPEWDARVLIGMERRFIFSLLEGMFGGDSSEPAFEASRPFTTLETRVARAICERAAAAFAEGFGAISEITLQFDKVEAGLEFTTLGQTNVAMVNVQILFQVLDHGGRMFIFIPQAALYRLRRHLEKERSSGSAAADPWWAKKMQTGIALTEMTVDATLEAKPLTLGAIARMKAGDILELKGNEKNVILECEEQRLFKCRLAQSEGFFTVTIESAVNEHEEMLSEIILNAGLA